jgi:hypothetical protein
MVVVSRSQWPRGLRRSSAAAWLLGSRVRIPLRAWMFVSCLYVVLSCVGTGLCEGLITVQKSPTVCLYVCDQETPKREAKSLSWTISAYEWMNLLWNMVPIENVGENLVVDFPRKQLPYARCNHEHIKSIRSTDDVPENKLLENAVYLRRKKLDEMVAMLQNNADVNQTSSAIVWHLESLQP